MTEPEKSKRKADVTPGLAIIGCQATGFLALIGGLMALIKENPIGVGVCLIPAALAFGIVAYISFSE
tara:strand:+ start:1068 stop:1268 length:201 start_codon:yes stop_codon:yes gene_type:complete